MHQQAFGAKDVTTPVTEHPALVWDECIARCQAVDTCVIRFREKLAQNTKRKPIINFIL